MEDAKVLIIQGSASDDPYMEGTMKVLDEYEVPYRRIIASAHRSPDFVTEIASSAHQKGIQVIIAAAGFAAHLAGVIAAHTCLPVIGVPLDSSPLKGQDALYAMVMMPKGVPVATMTIGKAGATNAAHFALRILALHDMKLAVALSAYRKKTQETIRNSQPEEV